MRATRATTRRCIESATEQRAEATTQARHLAAGKRAHHLLHLGELLEKAIDLRGRGSAAEGDPAPAAGLDEIGTAPLLGCHRIDDRFDALHLARVDGLLRGSR